MSNIDLEYVTTSDLIDELRSRHQAFICGGFNSSTATTEEVGCAWKGPRTILRGLLLEMADRLDAEPRSERFHDDYPS